jgi:hypothetical protein
MNRFMLNKNKTLLSIVLLEYIRTNKSNNEPTEFLFISVYKNLVIIREQKHQPIDVQRVGRLEKW